MKKHLILIILALVSLQLQAQHDSIGLKRPGPDTLAGVAHAGRSLPDEMELSEALELLKKYLSLKESMLKDDPALRKALENLIHYIENEPVDSSVSFLKQYPFERYYQEKRVVEKPLSLVPVPLADSLAAGEKDTARIMPDTQRKEVADTIVPVTPRSKTDTTGILNISVPTVPGMIMMDAMLPDTVIVIDSLRFALVNDIDRALKALLNYHAMDSSRLWLKNLTNDSVSLWLKEHDRKFTRFWLKNPAMDSVGIWVENTARNSFRIYLDDGVYIRNINEKRQINEVEFEKKLDATLKRMNQVVIQTPAWKYGGMGSLHFAQGYLANWVKGGQSSISTLTTLNFFANYSKGKTKWENNAQFKEGLIKSGETKLRKNEDLFEFNSSYGYKAVNNWYISLVGNLRSQFFRGYNYPNVTNVVSNFLAPAYLVISLGMDYKPSKNLSVLVSPLTSKTTIVRDIKNVDPTKYGLQAGERVRREMGAYIKTKYNQQVIEGISFENKLDLFTSYTNHPERIDVNWETQIRMRINFYMEAQVATHLIYDHDIDVPITRVVDGQTIKTTGKRIQFKELLSVGFSYKF